MYLIYVEKRTRRGTSDSPGGRPTGIFRKVQRLRFLNGKAAVIDNTIVAFDGRNREIHSGFVIVSLLPFLSILQKKRELSADMGFRMPFHGKDPACGRSDRGMREATVRSARAQAGTNGSRKERVGLRGVLHVLVVSAGWALFFAWWWEVLHITSLQEAAVAVLVILSVSLLTALATAGWVRYNLGIYRRKGPRRTVPDVPEDVGTDALGRKYFHPGEAELRSARVVTVSLSDGNGKTFSTGSA